MKIVIFGCGKVYKRYRSKIPSNHLVLGIVDNDKLTHGEIVDGYKKIFPNELSNVEYDYIVLMSDYAKEMKIQLLDIGVSPDKIIHYKDYFGSLVDNHVNKFNTTKENVDSLRMLIISNPLGFHGGAIAAIRLALCAMDMNYNVTLVSDTGDERLITKLVGLGINVILQEGISYAKLDNFKWALEFDRIIVNTFSVVKCALELSKRKAVDLWLHESPDTYESMDYWHEEIQKNIDNDNIHIMAVSNKARENFLFFYKYDRTIDFVPIYVEDYWKNVSHKGDGLKFGVIGYISPVKRQEIVLSAIRKMKNQDGFSVYFVGKNFSDKYFEKFIYEINMDDRCKYLGEKTHDELMIYMNDIDVIIVPSRNETFSLVAAEAMMMGRACIVSDNCGITDYIENYSNGLVFESGNADDLAVKMDWCLENEELVKAIGIKARFDYERLFSKEALIDKLRIVF